MELVTLLLLAVFPALVIVGALSDVTTMTIPNRLSLALIVLFFPCALIAGLPLATVGWCVGVGLVALVVGMVLFALRVFGGGDAKMIAAAALWLGVEAAPTFVLWTAITGGLFAAALLVARRQAVPYVGNAPGWVGRLLAPKGDIPYGVGICLGALMAFPQSALFLAAAANA